MKFLATLLLLVAAVILAVDAYFPPVQKPHPTKRPFPSFPDQGLSNHKLPSVKKKKKNFILIFKINSLIY